MAIHLTGINSYNLTSELVIIKLTFDVYQLPYISVFLVIVILHFPGHSEIGHFDDSVIGQ
jgi:hypothetical protein